MSRYYNMNVRIGKFDLAKRVEIGNALRRKWPFNDLFYEKDAEELSDTGDGSLVGGRSEEEFASDLAKAIFRANGGPCKVEINATYLEELPHETYNFESEEDLTGGK